MTIESEALRHKIREALSSQKQPTVTVLSSLLAVQDALGYLPEEAIEEVADFTETTINDVWGVASFYTNFRFTPPGQHVVEVCWGPTCHVMGAMRVLQRLQETLDISTEGETEDKQVTLKYNTCLGACSHGPVISIDHRLMGRITPEEAQKRVSDLNGHHPKGDHGNV